MKNSLFLIFTLVGLTCLSQSKIEFEKVDHDFGEISEEEGFAEYTFGFTNRGDEPIKITNVKASCGCTTPGWTREEVMPGDSGFVKARYNPRNRPGRFRKSLRISTSDPASNQTLYIMGFVKPKPKTPEEEYPVIAGDFRLKNRGLNIGKVTNEKPVIKSFDLYNGTDSVLALTAENVIVPSHIKVEILPEFINPKEIGKLVVTYDPDKKGDYGFVSDNIQLDSSDIKGLSVIAIIEEYFPPMTAEELDEAAKLEISDRVFDFGQVDTGSLVETSFELNNSGREKLEFLAIKSNCSCLSYDIRGKKLKKGKSETLKVTLDTSELRGNQYKSITIYSNDPVNPSQIITIKGRVKN